MNEAGPATNSGLSVSVRTRVSKDERGAFEEAARISGMKLSVWIRATLRLGAETRLLGVGKRPKWLD